jgi:hypothetical protein
VLVFINFQKRTPVMVPAVEAKLDAKLDRIHVCRSLVVGAAMFPTELNALRYFYPDCGA